MNIKNNTTTLQNILDAVNALPDAGTSLPTLTNPGTASDLLSGKELIDGSGNIVTGTLETVTQATPSISVDTSGKITATSEQTAGYVASGTKSATKQLTTQAAQTITPGTADKTITSGRYLTGTQTVKGDANLVADNIKSGVSIFGVSGSYEGSGGLDTSNATATAADILSGKTAYVSNGEKVTGTIETVTQATPSISVDSNGKITASATQSAGYVNSGTKSATKQLTTKSAQTITPGTSDKTISSGLYLTGTQTIKGDTNLVAKNIKSGISIFGVDGSLVDTTLVSKSGSTTSATFDTGLASIYALIMYEDGYGTATGLRHAAFVVKNDKVIMAGVKSGTSTVSISSGTVSGKIYVTVDGGTVNWKYTTQSTYTFTDGNNYLWYAIGTE